MRYGVLKVSMLLFFCGILSLLLFTSCSENVVETTTNTEPVQLDLKYSSMQYLERERCRFDLNNVEGYINPLLDEFLNKKKSINSAEQGRQLAEAVLNELQSWTDEYLQYIPEFVEYSTEDKVWIICYRTKEIAMGSNLIYIAIDGTDGSLIKHWGA